MTERIIIAGSGGQGIMVLGKVLATAAMLEGKFVTWLPAYGAEVRGGTAHCMVVISDEEIGSPYIDRADTLIAMNEPSLNRFKPKLKNRGFLFSNSSLVAGISERSLNVIQHPFTDIAIGLGNIKVANMVMLGAFLKNRKILSLKSAGLSIERIAPKGKEGLVAINKAALEKGVELE